MLIKKIMLTGNTKCYVHYRLFYNKPGFMGFVIIYSGLLAQYARVNKCHSMTLLLYLFDIERF